jgi:hypothetical protein
MPPSTLGPLPTRVRVWVGDGLALPWPQPLPLATALGCLGGGVGVSPSLLYKGGPRRRSMHNISSSLRSFLSLLARHPTPPLSHLPLAWPPKGLCRSETTPPLHAVVLRSFRISSKAVYFRNLGWIRDLKKQYNYQCCGFMFVGKKRFLCESPRSHVKHAKIKWKYLTLFCSGVCDVIWSIR